MSEPLSFQQLTQFEFVALLVSVLVAGLVIGSLFVYWLLKRSSGAESAQTRKVKQEFEDYKEKVDEHFNQTSEMFKDVTTEYKKLYDHMASSAVELCNTDLSVMPRLEMQETNDDSEPEDIKPGISAEVAVDKPEPDEPETGQTPDHSKEEMGENPELNEPEPESVEKPEEDQTRPDESKGNSDLDGSTAESEPKSK